jgi:tetratricopeptide (TPR) repeat protein
MFKRLLFLCIAIVLFSGVSYAGQLVAPEATNYFNEGVKLQGAGNFEAAQIAYQKVLLLDPYNLEWQKFILNNLGVIYAAQGDIDKAEAMFNEALKIDQNYKAAQYNLGFIYDTRRSELEALKYWLKLMNIDIQKMRPKGFVMEESVSTKETAKK